MSFAPGLPCQPAEPPLCEGTGGSAPRRRGALPDDLAAPGRRRRDGRFELHDNSHHDRATVEQFIRERFSQAFGSNVQAFMPRLLSLRQASGAMCGAFGLRGSERALFLEQYLDAPIEAMITARTGRSCLRRDVIEVGHLSGSHPGAVRTMIAMLTHRLHDDGMRWVAFTGTATLHNAFRRLGLTPLELAPAAVERLPEADRPAWGRYYQNAPRVFVGNVGEGHRLLCLADLQQAAGPGVAQ